MRAFADGRPAFIPITLVLETREEFNELMYILRFAQKDTLTRHGIPEASKFEQLLQRFIS